MLRSSSLMMNENGVEVMNRKSPKAQEETGTFFEINQIHLTDVNNGFVQRLQGAIYEMHFMLAFLLIIKKHQKATSVLVTDIGPYYMGSVTG